MEKWGFQEKIQKEVLTWNLAWLDDVRQVQEELEKEIGERSSLENAAGELFKMIEDKFQALDRRLDAEGCHCRNKRSKRKIEE